MPIHTIEIGKPYPVKTRVGRSGLWPHLTGFGFNLLGFINQYQSGDARQWRKSPLTVSILVENHVPLFALQFEKFLSLDGYVNFNQYHRDDVERFYQNESNTLSLILISNKTVQAIRQIGLPHGFLDPIREIALEQYEVDATEINRRWRKLQNKYSTHDIIRQGQSFRFKKP